MDPHYENEVTFSCDAYPLYYCDIIPTAATACVSDCFLSSNDESQYFNITVTCENWYWQVPSLDYHVERTDHVFFNIPKHAINQQINVILSTADVPESARSAMEAKILACAEKMADITHKNSRILPMHVHIASHTWNYNDDDDNNDGVGDDDYDRVVEEESLEDGGHSLVPASQSSIEGLEKVEVEEQEESCDCTICFEDLKVDSDVVRMPCMHLFHRICIVNWLHRGNFCPLCRFQMPTSDS